MKLNGRLVERNAGRGGKRGLQLPDGTMLPPPGSGNPEGDGGGGVPGGALHQLMLMIGGLIEGIARERKTNLALAGKQVMVPLHLGEPGLTHLHVILGMAQIGAVLIAEMQAKAETGGPHVPESVATITKAFQAIGGLGGLEEDAITLDLLNAFV